MDARHLQQIWTHSVRIRQLSQTSTLISPLKLCETLLYPCVAYVEPSRLAKIHFKMCMYKQIPVPVGGLRRGSAAARLLGVRVRNPPEAWMSVVR